MKCKVIIKNKNLRNLVYKKLETNLRHEQNKAKNGQTIKRNEGH